MKRVIALILILILVLSGCGKPTCTASSCEEKAIDDELYVKLYCEKHLTEKYAFDSAKTAYENLLQAIDITDDWIDDVYNAWQKSILEKEKISEQGMDYLALYLNLSADDLFYGFLRADKLGASVDYASLTDEEKEYWDDPENRELAESVLSVLDMFGLDLSGICVSSVSFGYDINGSSAKVQSAIDIAKTEMKRQSEEFTDYEHYPKLKELYTEVTSRFEFCKEPTGSFDQLTTTHSEYSNNIRSLCSDLDYLME